MAYPDDPDFSGVDALPDPAAAPKLSAELDGLATAIQTTATGITGDAGGKTPDEVVAAANAAATATRDAATNAATAEAAIKILKDAVVAWKKDAPKKVELDAAEKAVEDAKTTLAAAQKLEDEATSDAAKALASNAVNAANTSLQKAIRDLAALKAKRKAADAAYERERKKAAEKMKGLVGVPIGTEGSGTDTQSGGTGSTGTGTQSTGSGTPAAKPAGTPSGTPKPTTGTPAAQTPTTGKPSDTTGKDTSSKDLATLLAAAQQQNQQGQGQQQAQPTATQPQQAQQPQSDKDKKDDPNAKTTGAIDVDDLIREGALPASAAAATLTGVGAGNPVTPAPVANSTTTQFRPAGTPISGVGLGGAPAVNAQNPVTSGQSATGLHTASDVSGRSTPSASAFSATPAGAETKTSGATGGNTAQQAPLTQRGAGSGMPMMPMVPPMGGAAGGSGGGRSGDEAKPGVVRYRDGEARRHGEDTIAESVRGGTIAQNRPDSGTAA